MPTVVIAQVDLRVSRESLRDGAREAAEQHAARQLAGFTRANGAVAFGRIRYRWYDLASKLDRLLLGYVEKAPPKDWDMLLVRATQQTTGPKPK